MLDFEVEGSYQEMFQCLNPRVYFPSCICSLLWHEIPSAASRKETQTTKVPPQHPEEGALGSLQPLSAHIERTTRYPTRGHLN